MAPDVGRASVPTIARSVDLPEPLDPRTTETRPPANCALTPANARTGPNVFVTLLSSTRSSTARVCAGCGVLGNSIACSLQPSLVNYLAGSAAHAFSRPCYSPQHDRSRRADLAGA